MQPWSRSAGSALLVLVVAAVFVVAVIWAVSPEDVRGVLMLAGGVLTAAVYMVLYVIQRRRHWGS
jgi:hypothetical protein